MAKSAAKNTPATKSTKKSTTAAKATKKKSATKKATNAQPLNGAGEEPAVEVDRREADSDRRVTADATPPKKERRKVTRRRQIDPTTCERDYSDAEIEFMQAMDAYKQSSGRMFPTCSEILEVVRALGYSRPGDPVVSEAGTTDSDAQPAAADYEEVLAGNDIDEA